MSVVVFGLSAPARADTANAPSLVISQLKITSSNGQFVTLYNTSNSALDMSRYQLEYFNSYDLSKSTSSRLIALSGIVPPHGYFMVNDSALMLCYQVTVDSVSLGLSSTAGFIEVLGFNQSSPGSSVSPVLQDYIGWSKTATAGAQTLPANTNAFLSRQPTDAQNNPVVGTPGVGSWQSVQPDTTNPCNLVSTVVTSQGVPTGMNQLLPASEPPASIVNVAADVEGAVAPRAMPAADIGLMAPQVTELLPNPVGTGNDSSDEYIELYNPNSVAFDLTGFELQAGATSTRIYTFLSGSSLPPKGFNAFYSADTALSLSNTSGQVKLIDPLNNSISATALYSTAKDGQAWALANSKWYWTTSATPGAANVIKQPVSAKKSSAASKSKTKASSVKGAKTPKKTKSSSFVASSSAADAGPITPIHPWVLALIGSLALLYGAYEYRADMANRVYQFRRYLSARRANRSQPEGRRSD
ncbi:MAG: hypothetical protein JWL89_657 [Candidatus Saccharibacteria bacterium]|nr:hypothetical protein [Candidatus Saccharibacteria bacterium]